MELLLPEKVSCYKSDDREEKASQEKPTRREKQSHVSAKKLINNRAFIHQIEMGIKCENTLGSHQFNPPDFFASSFFSDSSNGGRTVHELTHSNVEYLQQKWTLHPLEYGLEGRIRGNVRKSHLITEIEGMDEASSKGRKVHVSYLALVDVGLLSNLRAVIIVSKIGDPSVGKSLFPSIC